MRCCKLSLGEARKSHVWCWSVLYPSVCGSLPYCPVKCVLQPVSSLAQVAFNHSMCCVQAPCRHYTVWTLAPHSQHTQTASRDLTDPTLIPVLTLYQQLHCFSSSPCVCLCSRSSALLFGCSMCVAGCVVRRRCMCACTLRGCGRECVCKVYETPPHCWSACLHCKQETSNVCTYGVISLILSQPSQAIVYYCYMIVMIMRIN